MLSPFIRMALNVYETIDLLFRYTVLQPIPEQVLWASAWRHYVDYLVIPALGLLLVANRFPFVQTRDARASLAAWGAALREQGLRWRFGAVHDTANGLALFLVLLVAYIGSLMVVLNALKGVDQGDETRVFENLTPPLILVLALAAGLTEEFVFRGILMNALARWMPLGLAVTLQAAFFGLVHAGYGTISHVVGPFVFGLAMAWVTLRLGLVPAIILHTNVDVLAFSLHVVGKKPEVLWFVILLVVLNVAAAFVVRGDPYRALLGRPTKRLADREAPPVAAPGTITVAGDREAVLVPFDG
ncbi:MAG TPA: CPBP family intramembrane glutamic endopeptidase [Candidatus Thermoplasmatota archaeon]|nr:CPBP family intramembrane glutamic endopeptidase [Candidatus Thermoplasmatota archaeon]